MGDGRRTGRARAFAAVVLAAWPLCPALAGCAGTTVALHALAKEKPGRTVHAGGIVTAVFPGLDGFFIEAPRDRWDRNRSTPEGVFVFAGRRRPGLEPGQQVAFTARYRTYHGLGELADPRHVQHCGRHALPPPVAVSLPLQAVPWRALLGMRVRVAPPLTVDDLDDFVRFGEVRVHGGGRHYAPAAWVRPGKRGSKMMPAGHGRELWLDDGNRHARPRPLRFGGRTYSAAHPLRVGQTLAGGVTGIAYRAFGRDLLEVTGRLHRHGNPRPSVASLGLPPGLRIVTFNVENYFNRALAGPAFPTRRGARSRSRWRCQTRKLAAVLASLRPAVAGLQEVENNGYGKDGALAALVAALNRAVPGAPYRFVQAPGHRLGTDLIAPALVYDAARVRPVGHAAVLHPPRRRRGAWLGLARPALAASFRTRRGNQVFTVVDVHLRSKLTACGPAYDAAKPGGGHCAVARARAIPYLLHWIGAHPTGVDSGTLLLGDLNAYPREAAVGELLKARWRMAPESGPREPGYTENGRWGAGRLDYVFLSPGFTLRPGAAAIWHIDADEAKGFGYRGRPACTGRAAPFRASDHDPVIAVLPYR